MKLFSTCIATSGLCLLAIVAVIVIAGFFPQFELYADIVRKCVDVVLLIESYVIRKSELGVSAILLGLSSDHEHVKSIKVNEEENVSDEDEKINLL